jgi:polysaccharide biosynthesis protein PslH
MQKSNLPNILVISAHKPSKNSREAGQKTSYENIVELSKNYSVHLVALCSNHEVGWQTDVEEYCASCVFFNQDIFKKILGLVTHFYLPAVVAVKYNRSLKSRIKYTIKKHNIQRIHCEYSQSLLYVSKEKDISLTVFVHDVLTQAMSRKRGLTKNFISRTILTFEMNRARLFESKKYADCDKIYVPSIKDREFIKSLICQTKELSIIVRTLEFTNYLGRREINKSKSRNILFWGAMNRVENADAALILIDNILPGIKVKYNEDVEVVILGASPNKTMLDKRKKGIVVTGFVQDPTDYFAEAAIAIFPLTAGAGVKVKVLECLVAGIPVITTEIGAEGINADSGDGLFISKSNEEMVNMAVILLSDKRLLNRISKNAKEWGEKLIKSEKPLL